MEVEINMINVEDGDAFIVTLKRTNGEKALIIIDGGYKKFYTKRLKRRLDELLPMFNNKISLVVCTHYDDDHLSGIECLIDEYHEIIEEIWIHKSNGTLSEKINELKEGILKNEGFKDEILLEQNNLTPFGIRTVFENYKHLLKVLEKIKEKGLEHKVIEATAGTRLKGFEELEVISPTKDFYNANINYLQKNQILREHIDNMECRLNIDKSNLNNPQSMSMRDLMSLNNPCDHLETNSLANNVSVINLISIVMLLTVDNKKYLFTGDAGIETFENNIPNWNEKLFKLDFLDLPHHGSKNNTSFNMINVFKPKVVFVSASNNVNRPWVYLKAFLFSSGSNVFISNDKSDTWYLKYDNKQTIVHEFKDYE